MRCDDVFANMSEPQLVSASQPVLYQNEDKTVETTEPATVQKQPDAAKKKVQIIFLEST